MSKIKDGGPAFPVEHGFHDHNGMTLRDYFAASALPQAVEDYDRSARGPTDGGSPVLPYATKGIGTREEIIARQAVRYADALIAELEKNGPTPADIATGEIG